MALDISMLSNLGLPEILLWLLTFAIVYGVLSQIKGFASREAKAIIAFIAGFLVLLAAPLELISVISTMATGLILIVLGILVLFVFFEVAGLKRQEVQYDAKGQPFVADVSLFSAHRSIVAIVLIIIAILIFIGAGGLSLLGWSMPEFSSGALVTIAFFVVIILAVMYMITEGEKGEKKK